MINDVILQKRDMKVLFCFCFVFHCSCRKRFAMHYVI
jgi:hypothetical protein